MKKILLLLSLLTVHCTLFAQAVKKTTVPPNKDTVIVTSTTTSTTTTVTVVKIDTLPGGGTDPGPGPDPGPGQSIDLSFTPETAYFERPGAGPENWNWQNYSSIGNGQRMDVYYRFGWPQLEGPTQGSYNWSKFDQEINRAISQKMKFSFGIMAMCPGGCDPGNGTVNYGGSTSLYPLYLHNLMQAESVKDRVIGQTWVQNWNSPAFLNRMDALHNALAAHINTASFNGVRYKDVINYIDIRIMGSWGEWHHAGIVDPISNYPQGMRPVPATYIRIINSYINAFPDNQLVMLVATLDANYFNNTLTPPEVTLYALTARNRFGLIGIRSDQRGSSQWNDQGYYIRAYMERNTRSYQNSGPFNAIIMQRWKFAPLVGEPENNGEALPTLVNQLQFYNQSSIGNGNYTRSTTADNNMRTAASLCGYKIALTGGRVTYNNKAVTISLDWKNSGIAPTYESWNVEYQVTTAAGTVAWSDNSTFKPRLFLPLPAATTVVENFAFANTLQPGTYSLNIIVKDPNNYRDPLPLSIKGRTAQGAYKLATLTVR